jgi:hypothetical protein
MLLLLDFTFVTYLPLHPPPHTHPSVSSPKEVNGALHLPQSLMPASSSARQLLASLLLLLLLLLLSAPCAGVRLGGAWMLMCGLSMMRAAAMVHSNSSRDGSG